MLRERKNTLTHRLLLTYALIALIPVIVLVSIAVLAFQDEQVDLIIESSSTELEETESRIDSVLESMARLETAYQMRTDLAIMLSSPEIDWNNYDIITSYINEINEVQRELFLVSSVDDLHVYVYDYGIPERWPIILHSSRLDDVNDYTSWDFSYKGISLSISDSDEEDVVAHTIELSYYGRPYALLQTCIGMDSFFPEIYGLGDAGEQNDYVFALSDDGVNRIIPSSYDVSYDSVSQDVLDRGVSQILSSIDEGASRGVIRIFNGLKVFHMLYFYKENPSVLFIKVCPTEEINRTYALFFLGGIFFIFAIMSLLMLVVSYSTKRQTKALIGIMDAMGEVAKGNFDIVPPEDDAKSGDVSDAGRALISLTNQLKAALLEMKNQEAMLADTQIRAMQNQINVHFLINTVESIKMQAMMNDDTDVEHSLELLGELFRYTLRWKERFVDLKDELSYISTYIELMNFRNEYHVEYINLVDSKWDVIKVPKMILQPIVENAFKYSFNITGCDGRIILKSEEDDERICINVMNDGVPFNEEKREEVLDYLKNENPEKASRSGSIGLKNIQQRLFMFYGCDYKIDIMEREGMTCVSIPINRMGGGKYENPYC